MRISYWSSDVCSSDLRGTALLAGAHLHHFLGLHQHVAETIFHAGTRDAFAQRLAHGLLETRVVVHHVPALVDVRLAAFRPSFFFRLVFFIFLQPCYSLVPYPALFCPLPLPFYTAPFPPYHY